MTTYDAFGWFWIVGGDESRAILLANRSRPYMRGQKAFNVDARKVLS
jgi:hypothetical protein